MQKDLGLYIHIPFCLQKCKYCDFLSFSADDEQKSIYASTLLEEIRHSGKMAEGRTVSTVYIGGGTPTCLGDDRLLEIIDTVKKNFRLSEGFEFTVEANPETVTLKLMRYLYDVGVNRISLGVQSMCDETLKKIGRVHDVIKVLESYAACRVAGFENVNYDLIFALPDQTEEDFLEDVNNLLKLEPKHLSLYSLQLEEGTPLFFERKKYSFADEDAERSMYYKARKLLKEHGLYQYETSNFAVPGFESRHNERYWDCREYLGIGLGASSYFNNVRYQNPSKLENYIGFVKNFIPLYKESEPLTIDEQQSEFLVLGLRKTKGISFSEFLEKFGTDVYSVFGDAIKKYTENGLLIEKDGRLFLSERGMDVSNTVMCDFM